MLCLTIKNLYAIHTTLNFETEVKQIHYFCATQSTTRDDVKIAIVSSNGLIFHGMFRTAATAVRPSRNIAGKSGRGYAES